jgi:hypothetical protein
MSIDQTAVTALVQRWTEITSLLGPDLDEFERELLPLLRRLEASPVDVAALRELVTTLRKYPAAYKIVIAVASSAPRTYRGPESRTDAVTGGPTAASNVAKISGCARSLRDRSRLGGQ